MRYLFLTLFVLASTGSVGCSSIKKSLGLSKGKKTVKRARRRPLKAPKRVRQVTRKSLEDESRLGENNGSLWTSRGQGAYLFHQNNNRIIGDMLNVEMDGEPKKQIETKVKTIAELMSKRKRKNFRKIVARKKRKLVRKGSKRMIASKKDKEKKKIKTKVEGKFDVKTVPTKIVGILKDGSFRVFGSKAFPIGKKNYQVLVSGIVRQEDFDDEGIGAEQLLDPKFDIVSAKMKRNVR